MSFIFFFPSYCYYFFFWVSGSGASSGFLRLSWVAGPLLLASWIPMIHTIGTAEPDKRLKSPTSNATTGTKDGAAHRSRTMAAKERIRNTGYGLRTTDYGLRENGSGIYYFFFFGSSGSGRRGGDLMAKCPKNNICCSL